MPPSAWGGMWQWDILHTTIGESSADVTTWTEAVSVVVDVELLLQVSQPKRSIGVHLIEQILQEAGELEVVRHAPPHRVSLAAGIEGSTQRNRPCFALL